MDQSEVKGKGDQQHDTAKALEKSVIESFTDVSFQSAESNDSVDTNDFSSSSDLIMSPETSSNNIASNVSDLHTSTSEYLQDAPNEQSLSKSIINSSDVGDEEDRDIVASDCIYRSTRAPRQQGNSPPPLTEKCTEHDELIKMFCRQHDEVCCSTCIALYHRTCEDVFFIPKLKRSMLEEEKELGVETALEGILEELQEMKQQRVDDLRENERDWTDDLDEMKKLKEQLMAKIEELETKSLNEIKERRNTVCLGLKDDIAVIQDMIKTNEAKLENLKGSRNEICPSEFVYQKISKKCVTETQAVLDEIRKNEPDVMKFYQDKGLQSCLSGYKSFGKLQLLESGCTATLLSKYNLKTWGDSSRPEMFDLSITNTGVVLVTDIANNKLKKLDKSYKVSEELVISGGPFGICNTSPNQVAVTVLNDQRVQYVDLKSSMKRGSTFSVGVRCRGICHSRSELFISCGGCVYLNDQEGPGHIRVFNMTGTLLRKIQFDTLDQQIFDIPRHLTTSPDEECIYVADNVKGLFEITRDGKVNSILNEKMIKQPYGVCLGDGNRIFVCSIDTHLAYQLDNNGKVVFGPLGRADGIYRPASVKYCPQRRELFIACGKANENLVVFSTVTETEI